MLPCGSQVQLPTFWEHSQTLPGTSRHFSNPCSESLQLIAQFRGLQYNEWAPHTGEKMSHPFKVADRAAQHNPVRNLIQGRDNGRHIMLSLI